MRELLALEGSNSKCLVPWSQPDLGMSIAVTNKWGLKELELFFLQVWVRDTAPPQTVPIRPGVFKAAEVWGDYQGWKAEENSGRSEDPQGGLILLATELREGWGCHSQEQLSSSEGAVRPYFQGTLTLTLCIYAMITNKNGNSKSPFLPFRIWYSVALVQQGLEKSWHSLVPGGLSLNFLVNVYVLTSLAPGFQNDKNEK